MKTFSYFFASLILPLLFVHSAVAETQIKLTGRKDLVLSVESRATVLDVARKHLHDKKEDFIGDLSKVKTPYAFEQPPAESVGSEPGQQAAVIHYDDASVLSAVAANFAEQVRGTLARGSSNFLQLKGGSMIQAGTSFPVSIPQAKGQTFTVTIMEISEDGYTLQLGEATQTISLNANSLSGSGAIKLD